MQMIEHSDSDARLRTKKTQRLEYHFHWDHRLPCMITHSHTKTHINWKKNTPNQKQKCDSPSATWSGTSSTTRIAGTADPSRRTGNTCTWWYGRMCSTDRRTCCVHLCVEEQKVKKKTLTQEGNYPANVDFNI